MLVVYKRRVESDAGGTIVYYINAMHTWSKNTNVQNMTYTLRLTVFIGVQNTVTSIKRRRLARDQEADFKNKCIRDKSISILYLTYE